MKDPLAYTYDGLERELNLLEIHLKEAPKGDEAFCQDCIDKHISTSRGFALEGPSFTQDKDEQNNFLKAEKELREIKGKNYKKQGVKYAQKVRNIRKSLIDYCPTCVINPTKGLNNPSNSNNHTHNSGRISDHNQLNGENKEMSKEIVKEIGMMNVGQFAAEGVKYLADTYPTLEPGKYSKAVKLGGGLGLQILPLFIKKMPKILKGGFLVIGSNLLAAGVVEMVKGTTTPTVVRARAGVAPVSANVAQGNVGKFTGRPNGRVFAGPVTATNVPTQYARAGILSGAQAFEAPMHADLIRVD